MLISCYCVDEDGLEVPDATPYVKFISNSLGKIVGPGSDNADHNPVTEPNRKMRAGRASVAVLIGKNPGTLKLYAEAEGLTPTVLNIELK